MKKIFLTIFSIYLIIAFIGCKNDASTNPGGGGLGTGGGGGGGGNTGNVTVQVSLVQDNQQQLFYRFTPSATVFMKQIVANCAAANVNNETVPVNLSSGTNDPIDVGPVQGVQQGQQWSFTITGNVGNQQGTAFSYSTTFTVQ